MKQTLAMMSILLIIGIHREVASSTVHVPADQPTIQAGIEAAVNGDTVLVARGTYTENLDLTGKTITVRSELGVMVTIIDGAQSGSTITFQSTETTETVVSGFTIRNGSGTGDGDYTYGGGVYFRDGASGTIESCTITENRADDGGGVWLEDAASIFTNCLFSLNRATSWGGALSLYYTEPTIAGCIFTGNEAQSGGGLYLFFSFPEISGCTFSGNSAGNGGGAFYLVSNPKIENCLFLENRARIRGGGILCGLGSTSTIGHCTFSQNHALYGGAVCSYYARIPLSDTISTQVVNSIFWDDSAVMGPELWVGPMGGPSIITVAFSDVQGGEEAVHAAVGCTIEWLEGNIDEDPGFAGTGDHHLAEMSPCIDTGTDAQIFADMDGEVRPQGDGFDMGADEFLCGDGDGDGFDDHSCNGLDCDDEDPAVHPGVADPCDSIDQDCDGADGIPEIPGNGIDDDCDGRIDEISCMVTAVMIFG